MTLCGKNTELRWYWADLRRDRGHHSEYALLLSARLRCHPSRACRQPIITTTGYGTVDFNLWPELSRVILVFFDDHRRVRRVDRRRLEGLAAHHSLRAARAGDPSPAHPHTVKVMQMDGKPISRESIRSVSTYLILSVFLVMASVLLVSLDNFDGSTTLTAVLATFINIGPGLGMVGLTGSFCGLLGAVEDRAVP